MEKSFHQFTVNDASEKPLTLDKYNGQVVLVVNVASKCGFTPQYEGLEALYQKYKNQNFAILGFPCNQFGAQEPGANSEIQEFCKLNYGVSFPVMAKIDVNGSNTAPVYEFLKSSEPGIFGIEAIKWNFTKFLVGKDGNVIKRYAPQTDPQKISDDIETALKS
jgi:glutathione peroxidase